MKLAPFAAAVALIALPLIGIAAPASAASAASCDQGDDADFQFQSYDADFFLGVDDSGRSTLTTVETFVAVFPDIDQNQGMRRAIPLEYQDAPTDVSVQSVTDGEGNPRPFETENDDDNNFLLVTSRADSCVHGPQTYVFTYTQHNVTRFFSDTNDDEFFWDTNGTGFDQPFGSATSRVHVPDALAGDLTGDTACYRGPEGATQACDLEKVDDGGGVVFTTSEQQLGPRENVTVSIGFAPHTFVPRDDSFFGSPLSFLQLIAAAGGAIAAVWAGVLRRTVLADGRGRPTIIAEYTPPKGMDPFTASVLLKKTSRAAAASFMDLAVKRAIKIVETPKTGFLAHGSTYRLDLVDATGLERPELDLAKALFGPELLPGTEYLMSGKDTKLSEKVRAIIKKATTAAGTDGLRKKGTTTQAILPSLLVLASGVASFVAGVTLLDGAVGGVAPGALIGVSILAVILVFGLLSRTPLTDKGAELRDHLTGLELYIRLAEADRLQMLQSPTGAEKTAAADGGDVVKVYEKLLPYAVLFSLEKEWAVELGKYYVDQSPDYYSGSGAFNAGVFAASIGSMSTTAASSYSGSASSSSSGGSGGGGSSGGGGGGGGGGGV